MAALPESAGDGSELRIPEPLEFFTKDVIAPENAEVERLEARRWRLLTRGERRHMARDVEHWRRELVRARFFEYHDLLLSLIERFAALKAEYLKTAYINEEARAAARAQVVQVMRQGRAVRSYLRQYRQTYENYAHYRGWLEYERANRRELKREDKREKKTRADMRRESKYIEKLIIDIWRKTDGCHWTGTKDGNEITLTPKIERVVIKPDAHWLYVAVSKRRLRNYKWLLPPGVTTDRLQEEEVIHQLRAGLKRDTKIVWSLQNQMIIVVSRLDSPDGLPRLVKWSDSMRFFPKSSAAKLPYTYGVTDDRKFQWTNFESLPHVLVAGRTSSGKSNLVNSIIATLASTHTPDELRFVMLDMKGGLEFTHWQELPHLLWEMVKTLDGVKPLMQHLVSVTRRRFSLLEAIKAKDINTYNARVDANARLARIVLVIDELNNFVGLGEQTEEIHNLLMVLVSQGRAVGVHVIAATQHPEVRVIPGRIKTNMPLRLCGPMSDLSGSMIVIGSPEAARLPNVPGRFLASFGLSLVTVQVTYITDDDIHGVVSSCRQAYPDVANELSEMLSSRGFVVWDEQRVLAWAVAYLDNRLSGRELHKMLGEESPGERHLNRLVRALVDEARRVGHLLLSGDPEPWYVDKRGKGYYLRRAISASGDTTVRQIRPPASSTESRDEGVVSVIEESK